jgi:hypothetical protein
MILPTSASPDSEPTPELLEAGFDLDQVAAFDAAAEAVAAAHLAALNASDACGVAARAMGLDLDETLIYLGRQQLIITMVADRLALAALQDSTTGGTP